MVKREIIESGWVFSFKLSLVLLALCSSQVTAQSTVVNIPSTDVVDKGKQYLEYDLISHLESRANGGFQIYVPRLVIGVAKGVEAGVNITFIDALSSDQPIELQPNMKWQFYGNIEMGLAATVGGIAYLPVVNLAGTDSFALVYVNFSKKFQSTYGPRFTVGVYRLLGLDKRFGDRGGVILGYEQPLHPKISFATDWFSGKNRFGYVTPGFVFTLPKSSVFCTNYSFGNEGRKNNALFLFYGMKF